MQVLIAQIRRQRRDVQPVHTVQLVLQNRVIVQLVITASMPVQRRNVTSVTLARHALRHRRGVGTLVYRLGLYGQIPEWIVRTDNAQRDIIVQTRRRRQHVPRLDIIAPQVRRQRLGRRVRQHVK